MPSSTSTIWDHCQFLRDQGIYFYPFLGFFVCLTHGGLVHPFHLIPHLKNSHSIKEAVGRNRLDAGGWNSFTGHMRRSFKVQLIPPSSNPPTYLLPEDWSMIEDPVPGLRVILGFQCSQCGWLLGTRDSMNMHHSKQHNKTTTSSIELPHLSSKHGYSRVLVQACFKSTSLKPQLFPEGLGRSYLQILHPLEKQDQVQPSNSKAQFSFYSIPSTPSTPIPSYISTLGWIEWLQEIELSEDSAKLRWLVSISQSEEIAGGEDLEKVEHGLLQTSQLLKEYLRDADEGLDSMAEGVRDAIRGR